MNIYKVSSSRGNENPNIYVEFPIDLYPTSTGWIVEDVITGKEYEFTSQDIAEYFAGLLETQYTDEWLD